jgi:hypothetical protein
MGTSTPQYSPLVKEMTSGILSWLPVTTIPMCDAAFTRIYCTRTRIHSEYLRISKIFLPGFCAYHSMAKCDLYLHTAAPLLWFIVGNGLLQGGSEIT